MLGVLFAADPTALEVGTFFQVVVYVVVGVGALLGIAVAVKTLRTSAPAAEQPVETERFDGHVRWATEQNQDRRDEAHALGIKCAVLEKSLENGLARRVAHLEERQEVMANKVDRCVFILEQEFGDKHRRTPN